MKEQAKAITKKLVPLRKQRQVAQRIEQDIPKIRDWMEQERVIETIEKDGLMRGKNRQI